MKWCVCVSEATQLFSHWKLIERLHFLGIKWNWSED